MELQNWKDIYLEISDKVKADIPEIRWIDLWHNQVNFLADEHPFPTPAVFINFRIRDTEDQGIKVQQAAVQIDLYLFYETFADTFDESLNRDDALAFLDTLTALHKLLHGTSGNTYSEMRRIGLAPVDTGNAGNLYQISFICNITDISAVVELDEATPGDISLAPGERPEAAPEPPAFEIDLSN